MIVVFLCGDVLVYYGLAVVLTMELVEKCSGWVGDTLYILYARACVERGGVFVVGRGWGMGGRTSRPHLEAQTGRGIDVGMMVKNSTRAEDKYCEG